MNRLSFSPIVDEAEKENGPWFNVDEMLWLEKERKREREKVSILFLSRGGLADFPSFTHFALAAQEEECVGEWIVQQEQTQPRQQEQ